MKTAQTTPTSEPAVNRVRFILAWFTFLFAGILWLIFASFLARHDHFRFAPFPVLPLFLLVLLAGIASAALHFFHAAGEAWDAFPYWLDESSIQKKPFLISLPNFLTAVLILGWHLSGLTISVVLAVAFLETAVCGIVPRWGELFARKLRRLCAGEKPPLPIETSSPAPSVSFVAAPSTPSFPPDADTIRLRPEETSPFSGVVSDDSADDEECEPPPPDDLLVSQNRCLNGDGTEREEGWFRVPFRPGETSAVCHLSFCPPFRTRPKLQLFQLEGNEVQITPTVVEPFGVRVEIKRSASDISDDDSSVDRSVRICFFADESESSGDQTKES